jgi:hypothetical protein
MATLESDKVRKMLVTKLGCIEVTGKDHYTYILHDASGKILSRTKVSLGAKHTIGDVLIPLMSRQIKLGTSANFVGMVNCSKSKEDCLEIIAMLCK